MTACPAPPRQVIHIARTAFRFLFILFFSSVYEGSFFQRCGFLERRRHKVATLSLLTLVLYSAHADRLILKTKTKTHSLFVF